MEFKDRIKGLRAEKGMTTTTLAAEFGKSDTALRMWETGRSKPDADTLVKLAKYFNCTTDYLLGLSEHPNEEKRLITEDMQNKLFDEVKKISVIDVGYSWRSGLPSGKTLGDILIDLLPLRRFWGVLKNIYKYSQFEITNPDKVCIIYTDNEGKVQEEIRERDFFEHTKSRIAVNMFWICDYFREQCVETKQKERVSDANTQE